MANAFQCHYMKAAAFRINASVHSSEKHLKYDLFVDQFKNVVIERKHFYTYLKRFIEYSRRKKLKTVEKEGFINVFGIENWEKLDPENMRLHTFFKCNPCHHFPITLNTPSSNLNTQLPTPFPTSTGEHPEHSLNSNPTSSDASTFSSTPLSIQTNIFSDTQSECPDAILESTSPKTPSNLFCTNCLSSSAKTPTTPLSSLTITIPIPDKPLSGADKIAARDLIVQANDKFKTKFGKLFTDLAPKVKESKLQPRLTDAEKKKHIRRMQRGIKKTTESNMHSRDALVHYGIRQTGSQYRKQRAATFLESTEKAVLRTEKRNYILLNSPFSQW